MACCPLPHAGRSGGVVYDLYTGRLRWPWRTHVSVLYDVEREFDGSGVEGFNAPVAPGEAKALVPWLREKASTVATVDPESAEVFRAAAARIAAGS